MSSVYFENKNNQDFRACFCIKKGIFNKYLTLYFKDLKSVGSITKGTWNSICIFNVDLKNDAWEY